ncbi:MAG: ROK family protein [Terrimicrobiaceae bacterium]|nr:ROK family protein [Terrimicrobiaceae bacterium]
MTLLGIDIGGTGIKGAPVDVETGALLAERFRIPTPQPSLPNAVADVVGQIAEHFKYKGPTGVTFPAVVKKGIIYSAANVDPSWIGTDANALFAAHIDGPVEVVNDADAAGIAEMRFGAGRDRDGVVILLTLGTGIGSAIFLNGKLLPNTEFGHLKIRGKDAEKRASEKVREDKDLTWKAWSAHLSEFLGELERLFSPDLFIIGGGASKKSAKFLPFLTTKTEVLIVPAEMHNEAGIIGAAYLAKHLVAPAQ